MSETGLGKHAGIACRPKGGRAIAFGAAGWLHLAAAPVLALMALLTAVLDTDAHQMTCLGMAGASPLSSMSLMYLLMSAFHAAPWLRRMVRRR